MSDDTSTPGSQSTVIIPEEVQAKFPDLVKGVMESESMDDEERKYWFSVLPIMSEDQIDELRDILTTEKKRLAAIDAGQDPDKAMEAEINEKTRIQKVAERKKKEKVNRSEDHDEAEDLLSELENL